MSGATKQLLRKEAGLSAKSRVPVLIIEGPFPPKFVSDMREVMPEVKGDPNWQTRKRPYVTVGRTWKTSLIID